MPEDKARAIKIYSKLQDLVEMYDVHLNKCYSIESDPDEMEFEYRFQKEMVQRKKMILKQNLFENIFLGMILIDKKYGI